MLSVISSEFVNNEHSASVFSCKLPFTAESDIRSLALIGHFLVSAIPNVYLSKAVDSTANINIYANKTNVLPGSVQTFHVVLADLESGGNVISAGSRLIINMPSGWTTPVVTGNTGFTIPPPQNFPDGSSQIVGILNNPLNNAGKTITFTRSHHRFLTLECM